MSEAEAIGRIAALPEVKALGSPKSKPVVWATASGLGPCGGVAGRACPSGGEFELFAGFEEDGERYPEHHFFVARSGGAIRVEVGFQLHASPKPTIMPYATWALVHGRRMRALEIVRQLPEVVAWEQWLRRVSTKDNPTSMALWTERYPGADCDGAECEFAFYVGENHIGSHSVRWNSFVVHPEARKIAVVPLSGIETAYDTWRSSFLAKAAADFGVEFARLDGPFPAMANGKGELGYGAASKTVDSAAAWGHPVKDALAKHGFEVTRVELYAGGTYPVLFVKPAAGRARLLVRAIEDPFAVRLVAHALLAENGGFAFELVEDEGNGGKSRERYRYRGRARTFERWVGEAWKGL